MSWWVALGGWTLGSFLAAFVRAAWLDRHPLELELRIHENGRSVLRTNRRLEGKEFDVLSAAVERMPGLTLDAYRPWKFDGKTPLPDPEPVGPDPGEVWRG